MTTFPATATHFLHKNHELRLVSMPASSVMCDGCKQYVKGSEHYRCEGCNFDLHPHCATGPRTLNLPLFLGGEFTLYNVRGEPACGACQGKVVGLGYSNELDIFVHPCCAFLPTRVVQDCRAFQLVKDASATCIICKDKSQYLSYRTTYDDGEQAYLHVPCLVRNNNTLTGRLDWTAGAPIMQGVMGAFPRKMVAAAANGGGGAMQTAGTVFSALNLVVKLVTLDTEGIAENWHQLTGGSDE